MPRSIARGYRSRVPFTLLPAIDVAEGRLAVYEPAGPRPLEAYGGDPLVAAAALARAGARWLHLVDMDLAFLGEARNLDVLARVRAAHPYVRIQASGGIVTEEVARAALAAGADRVVLGSGILADGPATEAVLRALGAAAVVGIEVEDGRIRDRGAGHVDVDLMVTLAWLHAAGAPAFLVTAVTRVGGLAGPDVELIRRVVGVGPPTLAAGGITSLEDLRAVRAAGAAGAVVGRAAIDGRLDLPAALEWAAV